MSSNKIPVRKRSVAGNPIFWQAMITVIAATSIFAMLWLFRPYQLLSVIGMAVTQVGALVLSLYLLRMRQNRPRALGLLVGLLVIDLIVPAILFIAFLLAMQGLKNF